ncbi:MAG: hypothetical protein GWP06_12310 [Actinobacteria bacterium]|nr:hypothetical protein [Actinomycetota bacterium]
MMTRNFALLAILGASWGILETQVGTTLHALSIPFTGALMMSVGILFLIAGRYFTGIRGSSFFLAFSAGFIKFLFIGGIAFYPVLGIFIETILFESIIWTRWPSRKRYALAGALVICYSLFHPFLTQGLLGGWKIVAVYAKIVSSGSRILGLNESLGFIIFIVLFVLHGGIGAAAATASLNFVEKLESRGILKRTPAKDKHALQEPIN